MTAALNAKYEKAAQIRDKRKAKQTEQAGDWKGFVACELTDKQKEAAKQLRADADRLFDNVFSMVEDGYKLSFSVDNYNGMYICSATCKDKASPNNGMTLTGRGGAMLGAMASLWYKHDVVLERVWGGVEARRTNHPDEDELG